MTVAMWEEMRFIAMEYFDATTLKHLLPESTRETKDFVVL